MIIIVGDLHVKNREPFLSSICKTFEWIRDEFGSDITLIQLGDLFDTSSPHHDIEFKIIEKLLQFRQVFILTGNHDYSKIKGNSLLPLMHHRTITVLEEATEVILEGNKYLLLPYLYSNMKEKYEILQGKYDYICTHVTPCECAFGDEGIDLHPEGIYVHGHTHIATDFRDKYNNLNIVLGVPLPTRYGEQNQHFRIMKIENKNYEFVLVPQYYTYETIEYGQEPQGINNIINVINAPSVQSVYEKYGKYNIREEGIELLMLEVENENKNEFESGSLKDKFIKFAKDNNMDESLIKVCLSYF